MKKAKTFFFGAAGFILAAILSAVLLGGLESSLATLIGYVGGIVFTYTAIKFKWIGKIKAIT